MSKVDASKGLEARWEVARQKMADAEAAGDQAAADAWEDRADRLYVRITGEVPSDARVSVPAGAEELWIGKWWRGFRGLPMWVQVAIPLATIVVALAANIPQDEPETESQGCRVADSLVKTARSNAQYGENVIEQLRAEERAHDLCPQRW